MSVMPCFFKSFKACSITGQFATGSMGLGVLHVSGRIRVPKPPAITIAIMFLIIAMGRFHQEKLDKPLQLGYALFLIKKTALFVAVLAP